MRCDFRRTKVKVDGFTDIIVYAYRCLRVGVSFRVYPESNMTQPFDIRTVGYAHETFFRSLHLTLIRF